MKHIITLLALFCGFLASLAQTSEGPIVPLTERGYLTTERSTYQLGDTLRVHGVMLSTDYTDFYPYSRYVTLELICPTADRSAEADHVIVSQKVRTNNHGAFYATLPTDGCRAEGRYYLRAYTQFMRNRPAETFPMASVTLNYGSPALPKAEGGDWTVAFYPEGEKLQAGIQQRAAVYVRDRYGNPVGGAELTAVCGGDTLAIADTRPSGYGALSFMSLDEGTQPQLIVSRDGREMSIALPVVAPAGPALSAFIAGRKLRVQISGAAEGCHLYAFQAGFGITEHPIGTGILAIDTNDLPDGLITFWLTDGHSVLSHRSVWVGRVGNQRPDSIPEGAISIRHIATADNPTSHAFESLCLLPQVRSALPFPATFYAETEREARTDLDLWLLSTRFIAFDIRDAVKANFEYPYDPERCLTLNGYAYDQQQRPLVFHQVEMVNLRTMKSYVCEVNSDGRYSQPVDDYWDGDTFFIESICRCGKNHRYGASFEEPTPATMYNWLRLAEEAYSTVGNHAKAVSTTSELAGGIDLNEVTVKAQRLNRDWRKSQMDGLFYFDHETLQNPTFRDLEAVLRRTGWVDIVTGNSRPEATLRNQGSRFSATDYVSQASGDERVAGERFCRWRNNRNRSLVPTGTDHMNILLDGVLITHSYDHILSSTVDNYESIEIVGPNTSDSRLLANYSPNGLIILRSRHLISAKDIPAKGINVQPIGLTLPLCSNANAQLQPARGERIAVDLITPDHQVISWEE